MDLISETFRISKPTAIKFAFTCFGVILGYIITHYFEKLQRKKVITKGDKKACKVALVINAGLKMGKGKVAAQCGHSVVGLCKRAKRSHENYYKNWERKNFTTTLVRVESDDEFDDLIEEAKKKSMCHYLVADAGRTQIKSGSLTVLGIGPGPEDIIDGIVANLPNY